jgi:hypothetical protein
MTRLNERKMGPKGEKLFTKKDVWPPPFQRFYFFGSEVFYLQGDSHQKEFEKDLALFVVK